MKMSIATLLFGAVVACAFSHSIPLVYAQGYPEYSRVSGPSRHPRDLSWGTSIGDSGSAFGTLGMSDMGPFGKAGYQHNIFDDGRGNLQGLAYGTRVLGPDGGSTSFGGGLDWHNDNAKATLDVSRSMDGDSMLSATGSRVWHLDKDTDFNLGGKLSHDFHGNTDMGIVGGVERRF